MCKKIDMENFILTCQVKRRWQNFGTLGPSLPNATYVYISLVHLALGVRRVRKPSCRSIEDTSSLMNLEDRSAEDVFNPRSEDLPTDDLFHFIKFYFIFFLPNQSTSSA